MSAARLPNTEGLTSMFEKTKSSFKKKGAMRINSKEVKSERMVKVEPRKAERPTRVTVVTRPNLPLVKDPVLQNVARAGDDVKYILSSCKFDNAEDVAWQCKFIYFVNDLIIIIHIYKYNINTIYLLGKIKKV